MAAAMLNTRKMSVPAKLAILVVLIVVFILPLWIDSYSMRIATGVFMWAGLALSWNVICGYAGYISFGHIAFFGIGNYATAILMQPGMDWNFFATLPIGALVAGGLAAVIGWPVLKLKGAYFAIATWALGEAIREFATVVPFTGGSYGISLPANTNSAFFYYSMLIATLLAYAFCVYILEYSRFGYRVKAVRDSEVAARMQGINAERVKIGAFVISAVIPAVLGGINAYWITFINPNSVLNTIYTDMMVVMVLVGGLGHLWGPAVGATVLYLLNQQSVAMFGDNTWYLVLVGILLILVVLLLPDGLVSLWPGSRKQRLLQQTAKTLVGSDQSTGKDDHDHHGDQHEHS